MKIDGKEVELKITPKAIAFIEEKYEDFDILKLIRQASENDVEPRASDYYKLIYAGYIGSNEEKIEYEEFLNKIEDYDLPAITNIGVNLLIKRKN